MAAALGAAQRPSSVLIRLVPGAVLGALLGPLVLVAVAGVIFLDPAGRRSAAVQVQPPPPRIITVARGGFETLREPAPPAMDQVVPAASPTSAPTPAPTPAPTAAPPAVSHAATAPPAPTPTPTPPQSPPAPPVPVIGVVAAEARTLELMNASRAQSGIGPLALDAAVSATARGHSAAEARVGYVYHDGPDGTAQRRNSAACGSGWYGENTGKVWNGNVDALHREFMAEPLIPINHRTNIVDPSFKRVGIGAVQGPDALYLTMVFCR